MATLKEKLLKLLPEVLPQEPSKAIGGNQLLELLKPKLDDAYSEASLRSHFSILSGDPTSPIAKVDQGNGYYLRPPSGGTPTTPDQAKGKKAQSTEEEVGKRAEQREEKFRSVYVRWAELNNQFPMHIEHTKSLKQKAGINKWKFPDVISIKWEVGEVTDKGFRLAKDMLEVKRSLGEQPFRLASVELKVELSAAALRQAFFQCVSNSKWAHTAQLAVACQLADETVAEELRRLGASYDVSVISFGLTTDILDKLPDAEKILKATASEFDVYIASSTITKIAVGRDREALDWEHIRDLRSQSFDMNDLFVWLAFCLEKKAPYSVAEWRKVAEIEKRLAS